MIQMRNLETRDIEFETTVGRASGYLAMPAGEHGTLPGVIIIHEYWGLNEHIRDVTRRFAAEGYVALAPDLYGGRVTDDADEAARLMSELRMPNAMALLEGAIDALPTEFPPYNVAAVGFCMGGGLALQLACHTLQIGAVAAFYGNPPDGDELARIHTPILFVAAEDDPWINSDKVDRLRATLDARGKPYRLLRPPGTHHAFFNDTRKEVYNAEAAREAWRAMLDFFQRHLDKKLIA